VRVGEGSLRIARREWESVHNNWTEDDQWALLFYLLCGWFFFCWFGGGGGGGGVSPLFVYIFINHCINRLGGIEVGT